jgi:hypothetical protein
VGKFRFRKSPAHFRLDYPSVGLLEWDRHGSKCSPALPEPRRGAGSRLLTVRPIIGRSIVMTDDEIALHAAIDLLRDSIKSGRMPSGKPLKPDAAALHERAVLDLDMLLRRFAVGRLQGFPRVNDRQ